LTYDLSIKCKLSGVSHVSRIFKPLVHCFGSWPIVSAAQLVYFFDFPTEAMTSSIVQRSSMVVTGSFRLSFRGRWTEESETRVGSMVGSALIPGSDTLKHIYMVMTALVGWLRAWCKLLGSVCFSAGYVKIFVLSY
jgi:hypothetical protein